MTPNNRLLKNADLPKIREKYKDQKIVFCSGTFDLVHAGHILFFEDCKKLGDILVVSVGNDVMIKRNKGDRRPILNEQVRLKIISSLRPVDYCILEKTIRKNSLAHLEFVFKKLNPNVYVINEDAFDISYRKRVTKKFNVNLVILNRWSPPEFNDISTTKIIETIKND